MRIPLSIAVVALILSACGKAPEPPASEVEVPVEAEIVPELPAVVQGPIQEVAPNDLVVPAAVAAETDLWTGIMAGGAASLKLDACPADSAVQIALMSVMCAETYDVFYDAASLRWGAIGKNGTLASEGATEARSAFLNPGPIYPDQRAVVVWGLTFNVDESYTVRLADGTAIGKLVHKTT